MTVRLDFTRESVVVWCDLCPPFAECALDRLGAWRLGAAHEEFVHPSFRQARHSLWHALNAAGLSTLDTAADDSFCEAD